MAEGRDHRQLIDLLEVFLLGEEPSLTGNQLAEAVGIPFEEARLRWRSLGFTEVGADVPAFTQRRPRGPAADPATPARSG